MELVGYVAYASLVIMAILWAIDVRTDLVAETPAILRAVYFVTGAVVIVAFEVNMLHSLWVVPFGCFFARIIAPMLVKVPFLSIILKGIADGFARIVRIGVPRHKIQEAQAAALRAGVDDL